MSPSCPIRYIITVNALKEGWDCPFAYILASLANKTSQVDVEQILGRILRLPHTSQHTQSALNMSYVLTSSNDFNNTVAHIVKGLNSAGFSDKDYRIGESANLRFPNRQQSKSRCPTRRELPNRKAQRTILHGWTINLLTQSWNGAENRQKRLKSPRKPTPCWTLPQRSKRHIQTQFSRPAMIR